MCILCIATNSFDPARHSSDAELASNSSNWGTLDEMAQYITEGYYSDTGRSSRKWNLSDTGVNAKSGVITYSLGNNWFDSDGVNSGHAKLIRKAFKYMENITGIDFQKTANGSVADIAFGNKDSGAHVVTYTIGGIISQGSINIEPDWSADDKSFLYSTILHEIGHVLGLGHPGNYNSSAKFSTNAKFKK